MCALNLACVSFCHASYENVLFARLHTTDLYNHGYLHIVYFSLSCKVKHFDSETPKALYKFPIIVITYPCLQLRKETCTCIHACSINKSRQPGYPPLQSTPPPPACLHTQTTHSLGIITRNRDAPGQALPLPGYREVTEVVQPIPHHGLKLCGFNSCAQNNKQRK